MQLGYPYTLDGAGRTAQNDYDAHIRALIEQVLFTEPTERLNRPEFGTNIRKLIFSGLNDETAAATQFMVQGALQQWLGGLIQIEAVIAQRFDETLTVTVQYVVNRTDERQTAQFTRDV